MNDRMLLFYKICEKKQKADNDFGRVLVYFEELPNCLERGKNWDL